MARLLDDANSQHLRRTAAVLTGTPFTMACWFRSDDATINQVLMCLGHNTTSNNLHALRADGNQAGDPVRAVSQAGGAAAIAATTTGYSANTWHHACGVWASATDRRAFIDGGSKGTDTTSRSPSLDRTVIGAQINAGTASLFLSGRVAEAAIWNIALSDAEVALLALGLSPLLVRPEALVAYWPLIGRYSPEIDIRGANDLTLIGTPAADVAEHVRVLYPASSRRTGIAAAVAATFTAALSAAASVAAALTTSIVALMAVGGNAAVAGELSTQITMQAGVTGQASLAGALSTQITPAAVVSGTGAIAADLSTQITPAAAVQGQGSVAAALETAITPAAAFQGAGTLAGALSTEIRCAAAVTGVASLSADFSNQALLESALAGQASFSADLLTQIAPAASVSGLAMLAAALSTELRMAGLLAGVATVSGSMETVAQVRTELGQTTTLVIAASETVVGV